MGDVLGAPGLGSVEEALGVEPVRHLAVEHRRLDHDGQAETFLKVEEK